MTTEGMDETWIGGSIVESIPSLFDGKVCFKCGQWKQLDDYHRHKQMGDGHLNKCKECTKRDVKAWINNNRDKHAVYGQRWRDRNRESYLDKAKAAHKRWYQRNYVKKGRYLVTPEHKRAVQRALVIKRRSRIAGAGGKYTAKEWLALCAQYGNKCLWCGRIDRPLTVDHVRPISWGGRNTIDNLQPLCNSCNRRKWNRYIDFRPH